MRAFNDIAPYSARAYGGAYAVFLAGEPVDEGHDSYGDAVGRAHDLLDAAEEEVEAIAVDQAEARDRLVISVEHFLRGIDEAAEDPLLLAGRNSALVAMLRQAAQPFERRA